MEDMRLVTLPASKEVLARTPREVVALLLRLLSRVEELKSRLSNHSGSSGRLSFCDSSFRKRKEEKTAQKFAHTRGAGFLQLLTPTETATLFLLCCSCDDTHLRAIEPFYTHKAVEQQKIENHIVHLVMNSSLSFSLKRYLFIVVKAVMAVICRDCFFVFSNTLLAEKFLMQRA